MKRILAAAGLMVMGSMSSFGAIVPTLLPGSPFGDLWVYEVSLAADSKLQPNQPAADVGAQIWQGVIIYDFAGYIDGSIGTGSGPANWETSVELTGPTKVPTVGAQPGDDPDLVNLVFRYIGPLQPLTGVPFDTLFARSIYTSPTRDNYQGQGLKNTPLNPAEHNTAGETGGSVTVPQVPEPASMALLGSGLLGLAFFAKRFKR